MARYSKAIRHWGVVCVCGALLACLSCNRIVEPQPERSFASAFKMQRNIELRLPGVPYAPIAPARRDASRPFSTPELAEAEAAVLRQLKRESPSRSVFA